MKTIPFASRGAWRADDHPRHLDRAAVGASSRSVLRDSLRTQVGAHQRHRVLTQRHPIER